MQLNTVIVKLLGLAISVFFVVSGMQLLVDPERTYRKWYRQLWRLSGEDDFGERGQRSWLGTRLAGLVIACAGVGFVGLSISALVGGGHLDGQAHAIRETEHGSNLPMLVLGLVLVIGGLEGMFWPDRLVRLYLRKDRSGAIQGGARPELQKGLRARGAAMTVTGVLIIGAYLLQRL